MPGLSLLNRVVVAWLGIVLCLAASPARAGERKLQGFVDCFGYGYKVSVAINGTAVKPIVGGGQQATRLFATDHPLRAEAPAEQSGLFILREGENTILVEFEKTDAGPHALEIKFEVPDRYAQALFRLHSETRKRGKIARKFTIEKTQPAAFVPIEVGDDQL